MDNMDGPQTALVDKRRADWHTVRDRIQTIILSINIFGVIVIIVTIVVSIIVKRTSWQTDGNRTTEEVDKRHADWHTARIYIRTFSRRESYREPTSTHSIFHTFYILFCLLVWWVVDQGRLPLLIISRNYQEGLNLKESQKPEPLRSGGRSNISDRYQTDQSNPITHPVLAASDILWWECRSYFAHIISLWFLNRRWLRCCWLACSL